MSDEMTALVERVGPAVVHVRAMRDRGPGIATRLGRPGHAGRLRADEQPRRPRRDGARGRARRRPHAARGRRRGRPGDRPRACCASPRTDRSRTRRSATRTACASATSSLAIGSPFGLTRTVTRGHRQRARPHAPEPGRRPRDRGRHPDRRAAQPRQLRRSARSTPTARVVGHQHRRPLLRAGPLLRGAVEHRLVRALGTAPPRPRAARVPRRSPARRSSCPRRSHARTACRRRAAWPSAPSSARAPPALAGLQPGDVIVAFAGRADRHRRRPPPPARRRRHRRRDRTDRPPRRRAHRARRAPRRGPPRRVAMSPPRVDRVGLTLMRMQGRSSCPPSSLSSRRGKGKAKAPRRYSGRVRRTRGRSVSAVLGSVWSGDGGAVGFARQRRVGGEEGSNRHPPRAAGTSAHHPDPSQTR